MATQVKKDFSVLSAEVLAKVGRGEPVSNREMYGFDDSEMLALAIFAFQAYEQGKYDQAETMFLGLCNIDPKEAYYRTALGAVLLAKEMLPEAEVCFTNALSLNDKEIASYVNRGEVYLRQGKLNEAAKDFTKAVALDPKGADPLTHRAKLLANAALAAIKDVQKK